MPLSEQFSSVRNKATELRSRSGLQRAAERQVTLAGYRMADVMKKLF